MTDTPRKHLCTEETGVRIAEAIEGIVERLSPSSETASDASDDSQGNGSSSSDQTED